MGCCKCCCVVLLVTVLIVAGSMGLFTAFFPYPSHASCQVDWCTGNTEILAQLRLDQCADPLTTMATASTMTRISNLSSYLKKLVSQAAHISRVFGKDCNTVKNHLIQQMKLWSSDQCSAKQQCRYEYLGEEGDTIRGLHTTPIMSYVDKLNFTLTYASGGTCQVKAFSESTASYAVIDFGVNYCNLRNLVIGSKLDENDAKYKENSTNAVCTMYSIAHCNLYTE